ncbi:hypothetical protein QVD17_30573 [Tagetes erecta]|uniref:SWIM-type domain-containing protein n=1 Tax=Tagetes erecta TaxID=13708 RepID=A0AAD8NMC9_TARER|nr:hypothetical protein QVD17_30573 [Tagetes erecta]
MCWEIGSTSQERKYERLMKELEMTNKEAWRYLQGIEESKWTLLYDRGNRRWGNLTTNISESMNNVLRGVRLLPIRALMEYTFKRDVEQYAKHYQMGIDCMTAFPGRMWGLFHAREIRARQHRVYTYSARDQRYMVETNQQTSDESGGSPYTIEYDKQTCTCCKWQIYRFPCSHALAVCHFKRKDPKQTANSRFYTEIYHAQYNNQYYPVPHIDDWVFADWTLFGDKSSITVVRGKCRARRMHNEMDTSYPEERTGRRCSGCKQIEEVVNVEEPSPFVEQDVEQQQPPTGEDEHDPPTGEDEPHPGTDEESPNFDDAYLLNRSPSCSPDPDSDDTTDTDARISF